MDTTPTVDVERSAVRLSHSKVGSVNQAADFQRLLSVRPRAKTVHFVVHHVAAVPLVKVWTPKKPIALQEALAEVDVDLSTEDGKAVDNSVKNPLVAQRADSVSWATGGQVWLGMVIPKKQAKRAVTRNLVRRQMREAAGRFFYQQAFSSRLSGLWLLRLKQGFPRSDFPSAGSLALRQAVREELDQLFLKVLSGIADGGRRGG